MSTDRALTLTVDGSEVTVPDDGASLLEVLRDRLGIRSPKDGCSPQGQCGCCTVLVDGQARVACVTPARRVRDRAITTLDGMDAGAREEWLDAFVARGASQCGFCTPGIIVRLESLRSRGGDLTDRAALDKALAAHLCRCTGWNTIREAAVAVARGTGATGERDLARATRRATIEGGAAQVVSPDVAAGRGGFADDTSPHDALVAVPDGADGWAVAETLTAARAVAGKVQGRRTTVAARPPLEVPDGDWDVTLATSWVEPAYLEVDTSWCEPGGEPASPLANGGAFGGKEASPLPGVARRLADEHGRPVRVLWAREDVVRHGPKRPPMAAGLRRDGTGVVRVVDTPGIREVIAAVLPDVVIEPERVVGGGGGRPPPPPARRRAAGLAEAHALASALAGEPLAFRSVDDAFAEALVTSDGRIEVRVRCGDVLDEVVLRSYCVGAAHMAWSMVTSEAVSIDDDGTVGDLTVRSFGVVRAAEMPRVEVIVEPSSGPPVNGSDAVFVAVTAAAWAHRGFAPAWPTG